LHVWGEGEDDVIAVMWSPRHSVFYLDMTSVEEIGLDESNLSPNLVQHHFPSQIVKGVTNDGLILEGNLRVGKGNVDNKLTLGIVGKNMSLYDRLNNAGFDL